MRPRPSLVLLLAAALALAAAAPAAASFPGANGRIAFVRSVHGRSHIMSVLPGGRGLRDLSGAGSTWKDDEPQWSADGRRIVFQRCCPGGLTQVFVMSADGSGKRNLSRSAIDDTEPAFSPDGTHIAFARAGEIWVMRADGSGKRPLASADWYEYPAWSPDGAVIAFSFFDQYYGFGNLLRVPAAGGAATSIGPPGSERRPDWAPDGSRLIFENAPLYTPQIWVASPWGKNAHRLRADAAGDEDPAYAPAGDRIVFVRDTTPQTILTMPAAGGRARSVTSGRAPAWQPLP